MLAPAVPILLYNKMLGATPLESLARIGLILAACIVVTGMAATFFVTERTEPADLDRPRNRAKGADHHGLIDGFKCVVKSMPFLITTGIVSFTIIGLVVGTQFPMYMNLATVFVDIEDLNARKEAATKLIAICGFISALLGLFYAPIVGHIAARIGRKPMLYLSLGVMIAAFICSPWLFSARFPYLQILFQIAIALGVTAVWVLTLPMLAEACDMDEIDNGVRREGVFTAMYNWGIKVAIALTGLIGGALIDFSKFDPQLAIQSPRTVSILTYSMAVVPMLFLGLCILLTWIFPLNPEKIKRLREEKDRESRRLQSAKDV
jgi:GPH family glycoside/pentoside/hexuronide:cation symporter